MKKDEKLPRRILDALEAAIEFSNLMYFVHEEPEYDVFARELEAAQRWVRGIVDQKGQNLSDKKRALMKLLENCAENTKKCGYDFLTAEFKALASIISRDEPPPSQSIGGETHAVH